MRAVVLSVGDELVSGLTVNTNATWLSAQLTAVGIATAAHVTVGDSLEPIVQALREAAAAADVLLVSGGLGPTEDDLTRNALAAAMGEPLVEDPSARSALEAFFKARNRPMVPSNLVQCQRPASAACIENTCGTAPGLKARLGNVPVYVMPGVPREMREMFARSVAPEQAAFAGDRVTLTGKLATFGMGESQLGEKIKDLMARGANPSVGTTVADGIVSVRIYATGTRAEAAAMLADRKRIVRERLGALVYGEDGGGGEGGGGTLAAAVGGLLKDRRLTIATAESCTGGILAGYLTDIPGSSAYFLRGWVTYANAAKTDELAVPADLIATHGAVSEPVARAMAQGARQNAGTDWAIATTGIAGPDGGTPDKPIGTVWIALAGPDETFAYRYQAFGDRLQIRQRSAQMSLAILRWRLLGVRIEDVLR